MKITLGVIKKNNKTFYLFVITLEFGAKTEFIPPIT
jgi:hypothetical protein